jgi:hypothetical protein
MWYFIVSIIFFILCLSYRIFDNVQDLVFGVFPAWVAYLLTLMVLYAIASLIFGLKTWKDPDKE